MPDVAVRASAHAVARRMVMVGLAGLNCVSSADPRLSPAVEARVKMQLGEASKRRFLEVVKSASLHFARCSR
jgi:hypothetical protein